MRDNLCSWTTTTAWIRIELTSIRIATLAVLFPQGSLNAISLQNANRNAVTAKQPKQGVYPTLPSFPFVEGNRQVNQRLTERWN
jgi:hypothetical protein